MASKLGLDAVLNIQTDGVSGSAGWVEMTNVKDLDLNMSKGEADNTTRANNGWRSTKGTLKEGTLTFGMEYDPSDANFQAIKNAYLANSHVGFQVHDGSVNPGGLEADFDIIGFELSQQLEETQMVNVEAKVTYIDTAPDWTDPT